MSSLEDLLATRPLRVSTGGKDESGTVVVVGGPPECPGAALLCATAALRVGGGRVQAVVHPEVRAACAASAWELYVEAWDQTVAPPAPVLELVAGADVVVIGPGHATIAKEIVEALAGATSGIVVLDAGALEVARSVQGRADLVLAPNDGEARMLVGDVGDEVALANSVARMTGFPAAVRAERVAVADDGGSWVFDDLPPGLGTPGSGDVFVGLLAGLLAGDNDPLAALGWATVLHAGAGRAAARGAPVGHLATDVLAAVPSAIAEHVGRGGH